MSIIKDSAPVNYPKTDYPIVKYLDLTKFISLLQRQALFFCRLDKLEDIFEGTTAKFNYDSRIRRYKHLRETGYFTVPMTDDDIIKSIKEDDAHEQKMKSITCVNCWNKGKDFESAALWKIYSGFDKGIMIKSSISRLEKSLSDTNQEIRLSEITYINYDSEIMPFGNATYPIIHKQSAYSYEDEVRLIHSTNYEIKEKGWQHDWSKEEVQEGIYLKADLNVLIEEIVIGPYSPKWFLKLIEDIMRKYDLDKTISKSKLSQLE